MFFRMTKPFKKRFCARCGARLAVISYAELPAQYDAYTGKVLVILNKYRVLVGCPVGGQADGHSQYGFESRGVFLDEGMGSNPHIIYACERSEQPATDADWLPDLESIKGHAR